MHKVVSGGIDTSSAETVFRCASLRDYRAAETTSAVTLRVIARYRDRANSPALTGVNLHHP